MPPAFQKVDPARLSQRTTIAVYREINTELAATLESFERLCADARRRSAEAREQAAAGHDAFRTELLGGAPLCDACGDVVVSAPGERCAACLAELEPEPLYDTTDEANLEV